MHLRLDRNFSGKWLWLHQFAIGRLIKTFEPYQPIYLNGRTVSKGERACIDRWQSIEKVLLSCSAATVLDLGCAEGFFVNKAAKIGCIAVGVDADVRRLTIAQNADRSAGAGFIYGEITPNFLEKMPQFDVVIFLSVMHHIMYQHGIDHARTIMKLIRAKTRTALIFDMGQSNEITHEWAQLLPRMEPDPTTWIGNFLQECGFRTVEVLGETDAYKGPARRILFLARP